MFERSVGGSSLVVLSLIAAAGSATLLAGPLDPPAGSITSTYKTLQEVEPRVAINATNTAGDADSLFKITQPGSYYLTGNVTGVVGKHGIEVVSSGVTIDLNGFELRGVSGMGAFDGISVTTAGLTDIAIVNGSVRGWGDKGIELNGLGNRVERVLVSGNAGVGIGLGNAGTATECSAVQNGAGGISSSFGCTISRCTAYANTGNGISAAGTGSTITGCLAYTNTGTGIVAGAGCTVVDCTASGNSGTGISGNITCVVSRCVSHFNGGRGIVANINTTVSDCCVSANSLDGIQCSDQCTVSDNSCTNNGLNAGDGANIHATGTDNRIEGNNCGSADRGIDVDGAGNVIVRNTCSGNTLNWDVAAGNVILVVNATTAGPVNGNSGGAAPGSTDPSANYTY